MKQVFITIVALALPFLLGACGLTAVSQYPSYQRTIAQYAPPGELAGIPVGTGASICPGSPDDCDCPRIWYEDRWVYHCDGRWVYWQDGYWYHYPNFYVYYDYGAPYVYRGPTRNIRQK